jgi:holo-[acyl-carrier protein] synthase
MPIIGVAGRLSWAESGGKVEPVSAEAKPIELRVGIDLVEIDSVATALRSHYADRYLARVYTAEEVRDCTTPAGVDASRLAARFAAKEAAMKALRVGNRSMPWRAIEVRRESDGAPILVLSGAASALADEAGLSDFAVSLTHERDYASAVVVAVA